MKNYKITVVTLAMAAVLLPSCRDFLTKEPLGQIVDKTYFNINPKNAEYAVNAIYDAIAIDEGGPSGGAAHDWMFGSVLSDESDKGSVPSDFTDLTLMKNWTISSTNPVSSNLWSKMYVAIQRANLVLDNIDNATLISEDRKSQLKGEALFLRGYAYLHLARLFGGVPVLTKLTAFEDFGKINRSTLAATFKQAEDDFSLASTLLKEKGDLDAADLGRATKGAAKSYLAYTIMFEIGTDNTNGHNWEEVYNLTKEIIDGGQYSLLSNYAAVWEDENENSAESIFEYQYFNNANDNYAGQKTGFDWIYRNARSLWGWGFNTPSNAMIAAFETNDPRLACSVFQPFDTVLYGKKFAFDISKDVNQTLNRKALLGVDPPVPNRSGGRNDRKMRYANVILMHAEAAAHLNKNAEAIADLKQIRNRANASTLPKGAIIGDPEGYAPLDGDKKNPLPISILDGLTGTDLLEAIIQERRVELAMEGWRYYDQVRTGTYPLVNLAASRVIPKGGAVANPIPLMPIPVNELNWKLEQNPGY